jgi:hypothetical protein
MATAKDSAGGVDTTLPIEQRLTPVELISYYTGVEVTAREAITTSLTVRESAEMQLRILTQNIIIDPDVVGAQLQVIKDQRDLEKQLHDTIDNAKKKRGNQGAQ